MVSIHFAEQQGDNCQVRNFPTSILRLAEYDLTPEIW